MLVEHVMHSFSLFIIIQLNVLCVLFPGLFTVMKQTRRVQMLMCISRPHLHVKTCRWKASPCFGMSFLMCPALDVNLHPLQRLVLWVFEIWYNKVDRISHFNSFLCFLFFFSTANWAKALPQLESQNNMWSPPPADRTCILFNTIWTSAGWEPWWQNRVVPNSEKQPSYAWSKGKNE